MELLAGDPHTIDSPEDKVEALKMIEGIEEYSVSIKKLVESHKAKEYMDKLHSLHVHFPEVEDWAAHVADVFSRLDKFVTILEGDVVVLREVAWKDPSEWGDKISYLAMGAIMHKLNEEEDEMKRLMKIETFIEKEVRELLDSEKHITELFE